MTDDKKTHWKFPNNIISAFRCTEEQYAQQFIESGTIKFNSPSSWIHYAKEQTEGRGDLLEGVLAFYSINDVENMIRLNKKYEFFDKTNQLIREKIDDKIFLRIKRSMGLPCYCFYLLTMDMFACPPTIGKGVITHTIPYSYFRDFADQKSIQQINLLPKDNRPSIIWIKNFNEFQHRIIDKLCKLGVKKEEIIFKRIRYIDYDKYKWFNYVDNPPMELTNKHKKFEHQNEGRIIVNTNNEKIKQYILNNALSIGNMTDIAQKFNKYCYDGLSVAVKADIEPY